MKISVSILLKNILSGHMKMGPAGAGMHNMGNTCYLNSTLQVTFIFDLNVALTWPWHDLDMSLTWPWHDMKWPWHDLDMTLTWPWHDLGMTQTWPWHDLDMTFTWPWHDLDMTSTWPWHISGLISHTSPDQLPTYRRTRFRMQYDR